MVAQPAAREDAPPAPREDEAAPPAADEVSGAAAEDAAAAMPLQASQPQPVLPQPAPAKTQPPEASRPAPSSPDPRSGDEAMSRPRARSLLAGLAKLIESPPPRIVIAEPPVAPIAPPGLGRRAQERPPGPPPGYEAPVHVGYLPAPKAPQTPRAAAAPRRFALLDEIAVARRRVDPRRGASHLPPD
ncbi:MULTISPECIES: hypothetical protein [Roseomonadaceae]|uniref:Uncharacterized protein n=1 Tax=Falsiroseomonas oleicola TaxID=2801474 RepID=A0ABS6H4Z6_9PROT|nr:hypothetical protein [Roseomonas oleicola]MBU8543767.1 hypothetical protein [Roseomonas oleicola]